MSGSLADGERGGAADGFLEIACDESGSDGENLTGGNTDVFAHAGVSLSVAAAAAAVREIRDRIRSPAEEYKANHLLREKHRAVLEWLLAPEGPIHGRARVHLMEKTFFVVDRTVGLLLDDPAAAVALFGVGRPAFGEDGWRAFLEAANRLLRVRHDGDPVEAFYGTVDALRRAHQRTDAAGILERLAGTRSRAVSYRDGLLAGPPLIPPLNPLLPAIVRTAALWSRDGRPVHLVHDRQNMLTPDRIAWIERTARRAGIGLAGLRLVVARDDARVQVADFLAGIARRIASDELNGRGDPALTALLRPYVDPDSVWGDARSGALLSAAVAG
ncbi:hypothetical protein UK15_05475 [Streptomyces variegatus]|uniref:DUF3800 domain-containing protein n=1 Tax=Streptomyces variegatus TaxID=284040 RepID=A0A0M2GY98_9ACTN|nr:MULTISPECIES: DUF3800 domain-containing protein [Streptomyces]KJK40515.1 hypothetical protein UK15_05475 [Streptomyces variegatus]